MTVSCGRNSPGRRDAVIRTSCSCVGSTAAMPSSKANKGRDHIYLSNIEVGPTKQGELRIVCRTPFENARRKSSISKGARVLDNMWRSDAPLRGICCLATAAVKEPVSETCVPVWGCQSQTLLVDAIRKCRDDSSEHLTPPQPCHPQTGSAHPHHPPAPDAAPSTHRHHPRHSPARAPY